MTRGSDETGTAAQEDATRVVLLTGPSGAGRSTAINALEDLGFETIDNLPLSLLPRLLDGPPLGRPLALGLDVRNRDFSVEALSETVSRLVANPAVSAELVYIDARADVIVRRYSETRRRHPSAPKDSLAIGVDREIAMLQSIRDLADVLIDTSEYTPHDLRAEITRWFGNSEARQLSISIQSFSFKRGLPRGVDTIFDVRFLTNPHWAPDLRDLDGRDPRVMDYVRSDARFAGFFDQVTSLVLSLLPAYRDEGKSHLAIAFGCTGGRHRSVAVAEMAAKALAEAGWAVSKRHRELERRVGGAGASGPG